MTRPIESELIQILTHYLEFDSIGLLLVVISNKIPVKQASSSSPFVTSLSHFELLQVSQKWYVSLGL